MSITPPKPKFGWSEKVALQHERDAKRKFSGTEIDLSNLKVIEDREKRPTKYGEWEKRAKYQDLRFGGDLVQQLRNNSQPHSPWVERAMAALDEHPEARCAVPTGYGGARDALYID